MRYMNTDYYENEYSYNYCDDYYDEEYYDEYCYYDEDPYYDPPCFLGLDKFKSNKSESNDDILLELCVFETKSKINNQNYFKYDIKQFSFLRILFKR